MFQGHIVPPEGYRFIFKYSCRKKMFMEISKSFYCCCQLSVTFPLIFQHHVIEVLQARVISFSDFVTYFDLPSCPCSPFLWFCSPAVRTSATTSSSLCLTFVCGASSSCLCPLPLSSSRCTWPFDIFCLFCPGFKKSCISVQQEPVRARGGDAEVKEEEAPNSRRPLVDVCV